MTRLAALATFEVGRLVRNWKFLLITIGFPVTFYMLFLGNRASDEMIGGVPWKVYLMISMCAFGALVGGLTAGGGRLSSERASGWAKQLRVTPIPSWAYVATKVFASMVVILPVVVLVEVVGAVFGGVSLAPGTWVELAAALWVAALPFAVLGVLIGFAVTTETAFPVVTALMFVLGYFGGLFNPVQSMPTAMRTAARVLPTFHLAELGIGIADGRGASASHWLVLAGYAAVLGAAVVWRHRVDEARGAA